MFSFVQIVDSGVYHAGNNMFSRPYKFLIKLRQVAESENATLQTSKMAWREYQQHVQFSKDFVEKKLAFYPFLLIQHKHTHTPACKTCELGISVHAYPNGDIWMWLHTGVLGIHEIRMWLHSYHLGISQYTFNRGYAFKCIYMAFLISCG